MGGCRLDRFGSVSRWVTVCCDYGNEPSGSIKRGEFLDQPRNSYARKKDSAPRSVCVCVYMFVTECMMMKTQNHPLDLRMPIFFVTFVGSVAASDRQSSAFEWVSTVSFHIPSDTIQNRKLCPQYHAVWTQYVINNSIQNCCSNTLPPKKLNVGSANFFFLWRCGPTPAMTSSFSRFSRSHTTTHRSR